MGILGASGRATVARVTLRLLATGTASVALLVGQPNTVVVATSAADGGNPKRTVVGSGPSLGHFPAHPPKSPRTSPSPSTPPSTTASSTIHVKASTLTDHECSSIEWHFVITHVTAQTTASSIHVYWGNGHDAILSLDRVTGGTAHYRTTMDLNSAVTDATAIIAGRYGQFNLSHGPCVWSALPSPSPVPTPTPTRAPTPTPSPTLVAMAIAPSSATVTAGGSQTFTASGTDQRGDPIAVTPTWTTSSPDLTCTTGTNTASCTATKAGSYTVTASSGTITATASLTIAAAALTSIAVAPSSATIVAGGNQAFTATGTDAFGNAVPGFSPTWSATSGASCAPTSGTSTTCTSSAAGTYTVTAASGGITGTATLTVSAAAPVVTINSPRDGSPVNVRAVEIVRTIISSTAGSDPATLSFRVTIAGNALVPDGPATLSTSGKGISLDGKFQVPDGTPEGIQTMTVCVTDVAGATGCAQATVRVIVPPPVSPTPTPTPTPAVVAPTPTPAPTPKPSPSLGVAAAPPAGGGPMQLQLTVASDAGYPSTVESVGVDLTSAGSLTVTSATSTSLRAGSWRIDIAADVPSTATAGLQTVTACASDLALDVQCGTAQVTVPVPPSPTPTPSPTPSPTLSPTPSIAPSPMVAILAPAAGQPVQAGDALPVRISLSDRPGFPSETNEVVVTASLGSVGLAARTPTFEPGGLVSTSVGIPASEPTGPAKLTICVVGDAFTATCSWLEVQVVAAATPTPTATPTATPTPSPTPTAIVAILATTPVPSSARPDPPDRSELSQPAVPSSPDPSQRVSIVQPLIEGPPTATSTSAPGPIPTWEPPTTPLPTPAVTAVAEPSAVPPGGRDIPLRSTVTSSAGYATRDIPTTAWLTGTGWVTVTSATITGRGGASSWLDVTVDIPPTAAAGAQTLTLCVTDLAGAIECTHVPVVIRGSAETELGVQQPPNDLVNLAIPLLPATSTGATVLLSFAGVVAALGASLLRRPGGRPAPRRRATLATAPTRTISRRLDGRTRSGDGERATDARPMRRE